MTTAAESNKNETIAVSIPPKYLIMSGIVYSDSRGNVAIMPSAAENVHAIVERMPPPAVIANLRTNQILCFAEVEEVERLVRKYRSSSVAVERDHSFLAPVDSIPNLCPKLKVAKDLSRFP